MDTAALVSNAVKTAYDWGILIGIAATAAFLAITLISWVYNR